MELHLFVYVFLALVYVGYPLYYLMTRPTSGRRRILGLGLMVYGLLAVFWPQQTNGWVICLGSVMMIYGFGVYFGIVCQHPIWLAVMAFCQAVIVWPEIDEPLTTLAAAIVLIAGFERCTVEVRRRLPEES
ncbi:MAG: hypothetical protein HYV27_14235 [Candidatus Hydrogenedentes bacterium]|nr:hypothetical protein [Candidatus Hydrogenedentota bacterium]